MARAERPRDARRAPDQCQAPFVTLRWTAVDGMRTGPYVLVQSRPLSVAAARAARKVRRATPAREQVRRAGIGLTRAGSATWTVDEVWEWLDQHGGGRRGRGAVADALQAEAADPAGRVVRVRTGVFGLRACRPAAADPGGSATGQDRPCADTPDPNRSGGGARGAVLGVLAAAPGQELSRAQVVQALVAADVVYSPRAISLAFSLLVQDGEARRVRQGWYQVAVSGAADTGETAVGAADGHCNGGARGHRGRHDDAASSAVNLR